MRCLMPIAASPALSIPGDRRLRGSPVSEPVIPAGSGGADSGANGFPPSWSAGLASGVGVGEGCGDGRGVCASVLTAKHEHKTREAVNKRKAILCPRLIVSPLQVFHPEGSA